MEKPPRSNAASASSWTPLSILGLTSFLVTAGLVLWLTADIFLLIFMGILGAILLSFLSEYLQQHTPLNYGGALTLVLLTLLVLMLASLGLAGARIAAETDNLTSNLQDSWVQLKGRVDHYEWAKKLISQLEEFSLASIPDGWLGQVTGVFGATLGALSSALLVAFVAVFAAADPSLYRRGLILLVPIPKRQRAQQVLAEVGEKLRWWFIGQLFAMAVVGTSTALGLWMLGIPFFLTLGLFASILTFIPNFGPLISAVPAVLLGLGTSPLSAFYVSLLYVGIQAIESNLLTPLIQQRSVRLPPVLAVGIQVLLGVLVGLHGLIAALPLAVVIKVLVRRLYIEDILGDTLE